MLEFGEVSEVTDCLQTSKTSSSAVGADCGLPANMPINYVYLLNETSAR